VGSEKAASSILIVTEKMHRTSDMAGSSSVAVEAVETRVAARDFLTLAFVMTAFSGVHPNHRDVGKVSETSSEAKSVR